MRVSREARVSMRCRHVHSALRRIEEALVAMDDQHMHGDILRHLMHQSGIDEAHQRQVAGKFRIAQKAVHARAQRNHRFQVGQGFQKARRRAEADEIIDLFRRDNHRVPSEPLSKAAAANLLLAEGIPARRQHEQDFRPCQLTLLFLRCRRGGGWRASRTRPERRRGLGRGVGAGLAVAALRGIGGGPRQPAAARQPGAAAALGAGAGMAAGLSALVRRIGDQVDAVLSRGQAGKAHLGAGNIGCPATSGI